MKILNFNKELIAYATSFVSFILPKIEDIKEVILFGSAARGEAEKDSDIDLFFNVDKEKQKLVEENTGKELNKFYKSKTSEAFFLRGIKNSIKINVGELDEWKLKRSIISDGIVLYGRYNENPENLRCFVLFNIEPIQNITKRNRVIRKLFGRKEKKIFFTRNY